MASRLAPRISITWLQPNSGAETPDGFYKTDHHWTMWGAYQVYLQIHDRLSRNSPELGLPFQPLKWFSVEGVRFRGTYGRWAMLAGLSDELVDAEFELPP